MYMYIFNNDGLDVHKFEIGEDIMKEEPDS